ncbi:MAG: homoserine dehydrogenase [Anaerolineaceae bacterium]|nr:MAG: homoserine dehydrogenase [Anaerolineaceae bacterium]
MSHYRLALLGFGNVGRAFARLLLRKEAELESDYGINFIVTGIATGRHGIAMDPDGLDLGQALALVESGGALATISKLPITDTLDFVNSVPADVLFENSPVNHENGEPAASYLRIALERGMHAVTANKGPVVHAYRELTDLAAKMKRKFYFESTVMDGAPIFSLFRSALPAAKVTSFRGILNSTTNLILGRMENGESFEDAVKYCQQIGLAETDPAADVDGWDAAVKVAALVTVLMGIPLTPQEVERAGIRAITPEKIAAAKAEGKRWKLVCTAEREGEKVKGRVAPELVDASSPLYHVDGSSSIVKFCTDTLSSLSIVEQDPGPETTAYGLLADFINAARE